jgi:hypothetical protein
MGRLWKALNRGESSVSEQEEPHKRDTPLEDAEPMLVDSEEIPFIEVGPQKSIEASPSVLACSPVGRPLSAPGGVAGNRAPLEATPRLARSAEISLITRGVPFRTVFLATPEMEAEAPQTDALSRLISFL